MALDDTDPIVTESAGEALQAIGTPQALKALERLQAREGVMTDTIAPRSPWLILSLFWGSILFSLMLPWGLLTLFEVSAHRRSVAEALRRVRLHFFAPGHHYYLIGLLSAAPFMVCAVFLLFHLNDQVQPALFSRRLSGVLGGLVLMFGIAFWTHLSALLYPDAQGALALLLPPLYPCGPDPSGICHGPPFQAFIHLIRRGDGELA